MQDLPTCSQCGQDEEFLVSETGDYVCICGHQFKMVTLDTSNETQSIAYQEDKLSSYSLLH
ncbi:hypothetical protein RJ45_15555 [Photobacterium gaetbulicola]|uniref:Uncharacterized protein n=1 Tax=Photobacterium gaetbulicola TaxID=1295392 RepID=A0A0B9G1Z2_9GAMM|nr:hypothetical protein RJ45_15555 [Photobacterium gaetbulicola]